LCKALQREGRIPVIEGAGDAGDAVCAVWVMENVLCHVLVHECLAVVIGQSVGSTLMLSCSSSRLAML